MIQVQREFAMQPSMGMSHTKVHGNPLSGSRDNIVGSVYVCVYVRVLCPNYAIIAFTLTMSLSITLLRNESFSCYRNFVI